MLAYVKHTNNLHSFSLYIVSVHLQNRLQNESSKRQQAEEWCGMLEKELTAHLAARQTAETKCEKLNQRIRLLTRKLKSQERMLRKRQKEARQNNSRDNQNNNDGFYQQVSTHDSNGLEQCITDTPVASSAPSGGEQNDQNNSDEEFCDEYSNSYRSFQEDNEPHFASDLDEEKIVEPQELQVSLKQVYFKVGVHILHTVFPLIVAPPLISFHLNTIA